MTELNIGDKITTSEQLRELPVGTIVKRSDYNIPRPLAFVKIGADMWGRNPESEAIASAALCHHARAGRLTILDLPISTVWRVGDIVSTVEETFALPKGAICCPAGNPDGFAYVRDVITGYWYAAGVESEIRAENIVDALPLRILHLPEGDETNAHA